MHTLTVMLRPIRGGWAITLSDGRHIARFTGLGAKRRALRYLVSDDVLEEAAMRADPHPRLRPSQLRHRRDLPRHERQR